MASDGMTYAQRGILLGDGECKKRAQVVEDRCDRRTSAGFEPDNRFTSSVRRNVCFLANSSVRIGDAPWTEVALFFRTDDKSERPLSTAFH